MNSLEIRKKFKENNFLIIIEKDGKQTIYEAPETHFGALLEVVKTKYRGLYYRVLRNLDLQDLIPLIIELLKIDLTIVCKHVDTYGVFLPANYSLKQKLVLIRDILLINNGNSVYSGIYNEEKDDLDYLNEGYTMKKLEFVREFNSKKTKVIK